MGVATVVAAPHSSFPQLPARKEPVMATPRQDQHQPECSDCLEFDRRGFLGTLGVGTGFCMAASIVYPNKRVLMVNGDGSFGLNGFDFDTFVRFNMPVVSVIGNDRQWGQILVGQAKMYGDERVVATRLGDNARYDKVVEALGGHGEFVTKADDIAPAIERAFASGKPACVNVIIDQQPEGVTGGYEFMG